MLIVDDGWKINFIDSQDSYVGFDNYQHCCEGFWWDVRDASNQILEESSIEDETVLLVSLIETGVGDDNDEHDYASFLLSNGTYLCLHNANNGYYCHGWESNINGSVDNGVL